MIFGKKLFLFFKNNFKRNNHSKLIHHKSYLKPFLSYLPCIVRRKYFSNVKKCALFLIKYGSLMFQILFSWAVIGNLGRSCLRVLLWALQKPFHHKSYLRRMIYRGRIFSHVRPFYEWAVSDVDRSMHRSLWVLVAHSLFIEGSHMTKNTASALTPSGIYSVQLYRNVQCHIAHKS
jgi:hypothetical protein